MMHRKTIVIVALLLLILSAPGKAQTNQQAGWSSFFFTQSLTKHWGVAFDAQFRSGPQWQYLKNVFIRPSVNYFISEHQQLSLGYAYIMTYTPSGKTNVLRPENRIWEQYLLRSPLSENITLTSRFRLEQRFVGAIKGPNPGNYFCQRLRIFEKTNLPILTNKDFSKGVYIALQNEMFLTVQNQQAVNKHFLEQNRAYGAIGYRFSKALDLEAGYLNNYVLLPAGSYFNNVTQLTCYLRL